MVATHQPRTKLIPREQYQHTQGEIERYTGVQPTRKQVQRFITLAKEMPVAEAARKAVGRN